VPHVYVARHGETDWNREGRYQGQLDVSRLSERGHAQARALGDALAAVGVRRVVSSPLTRCRQSAEPLARRIGLSLATDPLLIEIAHGTWEGRLRDDVERDDRLRFEIWRRRPDQVHFHGGESLAQVQARWERFSAPLQQAEDPLAIVTHDVLVRLAILGSRGRPLSELWHPRVENGGYAIFDVGPDGWRLLDECAASHLAGLLADTARQAL
jgi:broad specificity phosphatase PhoE